MSYTPNRVAITGITQAKPAVVTTASAHNLSTGNVVRLHVPQAFGMTPLNNLLLIITVLSTTTFSLQYSQIPPGWNVDSTNYPEFIAATNQGKTAEVLPVGSGPTPIFNTPSQFESHTCETKIDDAWTNVATVNQPF